MQVLNKEKPGKAKQFIIAVNIFGTTEIPDFPGQLASLIHNTQSTQQNRKSNLQTISNLLSKPLYCKKNLDASKSKSCEIEILQNWNPAKSIELEHEIKMLKRINKCPHLLSTHDLLETISQIQKKERFQVTSNNLGSKGETRDRRFINRPFPMYNKKKRTIIFSLLILLTN